MTLGLRTRPERLAARRQRVSGEVARVLVLTLIALCLVPPAARAEVSQYSLYQGRLTDDSGVPQTGLVDLELRLYDAAAAGTLLYSEQHLNVALDPEGVFGVLLGNGSSPTGTYDATLLSAAPRYLEVEVDEVVLLPRQLIGSVPTAMVAETLAPPASRFEACADGLTVADHQTGLLWEKKTGTWMVGEHVICSAVPCSDPHGVNNVYEWSTTGTLPDGNVFTDFLTALNDPFFGTAAASTDVTGCFAGHCDWRLPSIVELQTILDCSGVDLGLPCIDGVFGATAASNYWSGSSSASNPSNAWRAGFLDGNLISTGNSKTNINFVRAVRAGSCNGA